jgi:hypothetical protein
MRGQVNGCANLLQVVTLSVYTYFIAALMGRQFILSDTDMFFPFFTVLQVSARCPQTHIALCSLCKSSLRLRHTFSSQPCRKKMSAVNEISGMVILVENGIDRIY